MSSALQCPVFHATHNDVATSSFASFVEAHEPEFQQAGVCKISPPRGWRPRKQGYSGLNFSITRPIRQHATGRQGLYRTILVEQKGLSLTEFKAMATHPLNAPPTNADLDTLERKYWKNVVLNPPLYGADVPGSLFDEDIKGWSLRHLESLLSQTMAEHGVDIPGVNSPYLYVGSWRSTFAWHTEDLDLHSVNYLHFGAPKTWYVVPPAHRARFERLMVGLLPELFRVCPEFMRHKELVVSPSLLQAHNIPVVRLEQQPGEFVVTYPGAYHCGFNCGFNCAESVNFATKAWVDVGAVAGSCECRKDTVRMDMRMFADHMSQQLREEWLASDSESESGGGSMSGAGSGAGSDSDAGTPSEPDSEEESAGAMRDESQSDVASDLDSDDEPWAPAPGLVRTALPRPRAGGGKKRVRATGRVAAPPSKRRRAPQQRKVLVAAHVSDSEQQQQEEEEQEGADARAGNQRTQQRSRGRPRKAAGPADLLGQKQRRQRRGRQVQPPDPAAPAASGLPNRRRQPAGATAAAVQRASSRRAGAAAAMASSPAAARAEREGRAARLQRRQQQRDGSPRTQRLQRREAQREQQAEHVGAEGVAGRRVGRRGRGRAEVVSSRVLVGAVAAEAAERDMAAAAQPEAPAGEQDSTGAGWHGEAEGLGDPLCGGEEGRGQGAGHAAEEEGEASLGVTVGSSGWGDGCLDGLHKAGGGGLAAGASEDTMPLGGAAAVAAAGGAGEGMEAGRGGSRARGGAQLGQKGGGRRMLSLVHSAAAAVVPHLQRVRQGRGSASPSL